MRESDETILYQAVYKAIENGWDIMQRYEAEEWSIANNGHLGFFLAFHAKDGQVHQSLVWEQVVYNHDFAKALWPGFIDMDSNKTFEVRPADFPTLIGWVYHLQLMVVADDPMQYLGEHL